MAWVRLVYWLCLLVLTNCRKGLWLNYSSEGETVTLLLISSSVCCCCCCNCLNNMLSTRGPRILRSSLSNLHACSSFMFVFVAAGVYIALLWKQPTLNIREGNAPLVLLCILNVFLLINTSVVNSYQVYQLSYFSIRYPNALFLSGNALPVDVRVHTDWRK